MDKNEYDVAYKRAVQINNYAQKIQGEIEHVLSIDKPQNLLGEFYDWVSIKKSGGLTMAFTIPFALKYYKLSSSQKNDVEQFLDDVCDYEGRSLEEIVNDFDIGWSHLEKDFVRYQKLLHSVYEGDNNA